MSTAETRAKTAVLAARVEALKREPTPRSRDADAWEVKRAIFEARAALLGRQLSGPRPAARPSGASVRDIFTPAGRAALRADQLAHPESQAILSRRAS